VLIVGPNRIFLHYIGQVLPALGETAAVLATPGQLYPGVDATAWEPAEIAAIKGRPQMAEIIHRAVRARQRVPDEPRQLDVAGTVITLTPQMVTSARDRARASRRPHNQARRTFALTLLDSLARELAEARNIDVDGHRDVLIEDLRDARDVRREVNLAWMPISPEQLIADLFADPDRLASAAPGMKATERELLARPRGAAWTPADVPLLDEAAELLGMEDEAERQAQARAQAERKAEQEYAESVLEMTGTRGVSADQLLDRYAGPREIISVAERAAEDREWIYGHVVVDEAQELSPMAWRLLARRCPSLSMTVVGDLDQTASSAGAEDWASALRDITRSRHRTERRWRVEALTVNYRTPRPFMDLAREVLLACGRSPAPVESIRDGEPPSITHLGDMQEVVELVASAAQRDDAGRVAVITAPSLVGDLDSRLRAALPGLVGHGDDRLDAVVSILTVAQAKGLEFDDVIVVEPDLIDAEAARRGTDLYVAFTRATRSLTVAYTGDFPACLPIRP